MNIINIPLYTIFHGEREYVKTFRLYPLSITPKLSVALSPHWSLALSDLLIFQWNLDILEELDVFSR